MILREFKHYLSLSKTANIRELAIYLHAQPDAVRAMAEVLIRKRLIRRVDVEDCETGCKGCSLGFLEVYEWVGVI